MARAMAAWAAAAAAAGGGGGGVGGGVGGVSGGGGVGGGGGEGGDGEAVIGRHVRCFSPLPLVNTWARPWCVQPVRIWAGTSHDDAKYQT